MFKANKKAMKLLHLSANTYAFWLKSILTTTHKLIYSFLKQAIFNRMKGFEKLLKFIAAAIGKFFFLEIHTLIQCSPHAWINCKKETNLFDLPPQPSFFFHILSTQIFSECDVSRHKHTCYYADVSSTALVQVTLPTIRTTIA